TPGTLVAAAACMPFHAEALNDLSSRPPWSVTMQARYSLLLVAPGVGVDGAEPHAATANVRPLAARAAAIFIPRAGRKTFSFPIYRHNCYGDATSWSVRPVTSAPTRSCCGCATALFARDPSVSQSSDEDHDDGIRVICREKGQLSAQSSSVGIDPPAVVDREVNELTAPI